MEVLKTADGFTILLKFMDKLLGTDGLVDSLEKYEEFEKDERKPGQPINEYLPALNGSIERLKTKA